MKKAKVFTEFKQFAMKGNVIDMAVGVIIGGAFSKIVTSLVNDIVMPLLSLLIGRVNLAGLSLSIMPLDGKGDPIVLAYGLFLQNILDFLIVAICIFAAVKLISMLHKKQKEKPEPPKEATPPKQELLLMEIRDILKAGKN